MYRHFFKRLLDIVISFIGIIISFLPMIIIFIIINIDSRGGAIFKQKRLGKNKKVFTIYKYRTMVPNAYAIGGTNTYEDDPRITKIGKFLRKTSLDELPQLFNILKGEMSIIGPRPILDIELEEVQDPQLYFERFMARPGLFCTVDLDLRAAASRTVQFEMDREYYKTLSFLLDCKVFFGVIRTVVSGRNVYKKTKDFDMNNTVKEELATSNCTVKEENIFDNLINKEEQKMISKLNINNSISGHICIVFAQEHYNPLGLIRCFGESGVNPIYISIKRRGEVASKSKYISKFYCVNTVEEGYELVIKEYGNFDYEHRPIIVFSDDKSIGYFDFHYEDIKNKFIIYNAGFSGRINEYMDKYKIQQLAKKYGFNVLPSYKVKRGDIPKNLEYPIITKDISPNSGAWKSDVFICQNEEDLKNAYEKIASQEVIIQRFVDKQNELALEGFSINRGKEILICTALSWKYLIKGYYSPYHDVKMFNDFDMEQRLNSMLQEIGFEGIFEAEFLIDKDGTHYFLEINFRASAWNYTTAVAGMPISYLWAKSMIEGHINKECKKKFEDFTSMSEIIDYGKRVDTGLISLQEWIRDFKKAKCTYYYNENDLEPFEYVIDKWEQYK